MSARPAVLRLMLLAALDQLHEAYREQERLRQQIQEMRDERERYARAVFDV